MECNFFCFMVIYLLYYCCTLIVYTALSYCTHYIIAEGFVILRRSRVRACFQGVLDFNVCEDSVNVFISNKLLSIYVTESCVLKYLKVVLEWAAQSQTCTSYTRTRQSLFKAFATFKTNINLWFGTGYLSSIPVNK